MKPSLPALLVALAVLAAPAAAQDIAEGVAAYERGDYEAALGHWRPLAGRGDANAQASLGLLYARGHGVGQDYGEAIKWFQLSATQGYAIAQNNLGVMYRNGYGVQQNYAKAVMFYRLSAAQGYALAQSSLGAMYENGDGARRDYEQAYMWYSLAAAQGHAGATKARLLLEPLMSGQQRRRALARVEERQARNSAQTASKLVRPVGTAGPGNVANGPPPRRRRHPHCPSARLRRRPP
ncbi:MAG: sel1 repeat family protein [Alphaproteobacteria bacterium]|nr:sel1 repeat family protein [Alphaproteobacteria bacterium]